MFNNANKNNMRYVKAYYYLLACLHSSDGCGSVAWCGDHDKYPQYGEYITPSQHSPGH